MRVWLLSLPSDPPTAGSRNVFHAFALESALGHPPGSGQKA